MFNHSVNKHNAVAVVSEEASLKERTDTVTEEWCIVFPIHTVGKVNIASGFRWHTASSEQYCTLLFVVTDGQGIQDSRYTTESLSYLLCTQLKSSRCLLTLFEPCQHEARDLSYKTGCYLSVSVSVRTLSDTVTTFVSVGWEGLG